MGIGGLCSNPQGSLGSRSISEHLLCALSDILTSTKTRRGPAALSQGQSLGYKAVVPEGCGMCASTRLFPCPLHPSPCTWKKSPPPVPPSLGARISLPPCHPSSELAGITASPKCSGVVRVTPQPPSLVPFRSVGLAVTHCGQPVGSLQRAPVLSCPVLPCPVLSSPPLPSLLFSSPCPSPWVLFPGKLRANAGREPEG